MNVVINLLRALALAGLAVCLAAAPSIDISTGSPASPVRLSLAVESRLAERTPRAPDLATAYWVVTPLPITVPPRFGYYGAVRNINAVGDALGSDQTLTKHVAANGMVSELGLYRFHFNAGRQLDNAGRVAVNAVVGNAGYLLTLRDGAPPLSRRYEDIWLTSVDNADGLLGVTLNLSRPTDRDYWGWSFVERGSFRQVLEKPADSNFGADYVALNERNEVVGSALQIPTNWWRGLYLKAGRAPRWLPGFGSYEEVYNLNVHGQLVGSTAVPSGYGYAPGMYPALWDSGGVGRVKVLDTDRSQFGGEYGWAWAANRWGQIVGRTRSGGALWLDGKSHSLAGRIINPDNIRLDYFADINDKGEIVGAEYGVSTTPGSRAFIMRPVWVSVGVDLNRDGKIALPSAGDRSDIASADMPFRFWTNDDDDFDAMNGDDVPAPSNSSDGAAAKNFDGDGNVDGLRDLIDFFPVYLDIKTLLRVLPPSDSVKYKLKHADGALNFVYTTLTPADAIKYQTQDLGSAFGPSLNESLENAGTRRLSAEGIELTSQFLTGVKDSDWGTILVEAWLPTTKPLVLSVEKSDGTVLAESKLPLRIASVEDMYRWVNLRALAGQENERITNTAEPSNWPDSLTNGRMFVFLHGYNVNERDSRGWGSEVFKRMYWSGSRAMFTMTSWHGDHSQIPIVGVSPDYWENINYAFISAQALPVTINALPGYSKVIAGHSMGNVVVSSAIVDHGLNVSQYFMLNAAVALEAYDPASMNVDAMRHPDWASYEMRLWPTEWFDLFPSGDGRRGLTWRDRFGNISSATNFFSSGEDVLNNNDVTPGKVPDVGGERAWVLQEMVKGTNHIGAVLTFDVQGGWGFNPAWDIPRWIPGIGGIGGYYEYDRRTPAQAATLTEIQLQTQPFFRRFQNAQLVSASNGGAVAQEYLVRADALGGAVPALSFASGRNPVPLFEDDLRNIDLMTLQDGWPRAGSRWFHSDAKNIAYRYNHKLWDVWVGLGGLK